MGGRIGECAWSTDGMLVTGETSNTASNDSGPYALGRAVAVTSAANPALRVRVIARLAHARNTRPSRHNHIAVESTCDI
jgi:hypothetical protein